MYSILQKLSLILVLIFVLSATTTLAQNSTNFKDLDLGDNPRERFNDFNRKRVYPFNELPDNALNKALNHKKEMVYKLRKSDQLIQVQQPEWKQLGPGNIGGRVKAIAIHPNNPNIVYIGAAAGGIWKTTDGGKSWNPKFQNENSIAFGGLSIDQTNPNIIYAGTGEAVAGGGNIYTGSGIYKSTDEGETWTLLGLSTVTAVSKLYVHPADPNFIVLGAIGHNHGLWVSKDAGGTWANKFDQGSITDVSINPADPNEIVIAESGVGIFITKDRGENWNNITTPKFPTDSVGRISCQIAASSPNIIYALFGYGASSGLLYKTVNEGASWYALDITSSVFISGGGSQSFYDNFITVNPANPNHVVCGGITVWETFNGTNFANYGGASGVHSDQHCCSFAPSDPKTVYLGCDGGVYRSTNSGNNWTNMNNGLFITQFYDIDLDNTDANTNFGGTQDNGTNGNQGSESWNNYVGADGFQVVVDGDKKTMFGEMQYGSIVRTNYETGAQTPFYSNGIPNGQGSGVSFNACLDHDPNPGADRLWAGRKDALYFSDKYLNTSNWTALDLSYLGMGATVSAIGIAHGTSDIMYAGTESGQVIATKDINQDNNFKLTFNFNRYINCIKTAYSDVNTAYVGVSGYGSPHIYKTSNVGDNWINISGNLPDVPVNDIAINPNNPKNIYIGTDVGVFCTYDEGGTWFPFGRSLPNTPVLSLAILNNSKLYPNPKLRIGTHGRSVWEIDLPENFVTDPAITSPIGGEEFLSKQPANLAWYGFKPPVKIEYSKTISSPDWNLIQDNVEGNSMLWNVPNIPTFDARIRITSNADPSQVEISRTFTISQLQKGSVLSSTNYSFVPYGICIDQKGFMYVTDFYNSMLHKYNVADMSVVKEVKMKLDSFYTDIAIDRDNGLLYVNKLTTSSGQGGIISVYDTELKYIRNFKSPATQYPTGLEFIDGNLIVADRDESAKQFKVCNPTNGAIKTTFGNPCSVYYGPRSMCYDGSKYLYHICTNFSGGGLTDTRLIQIDKANLGAQLNYIQLENAQGVINARGVEFDPADNNFWVSTFGSSSGANNGNIYKVAGFLTTTGVEEQNDLQIEDLNASIYPNPMKDFANLSFEIKKDAKIKVILSDLFGRTIGILFDKLVTGNQLEHLLISGDNLQSGIYTITFEEDGKFLGGKKLNVIK